MTLKIEQPWYRKVRCHHCHRHQGIAVGDVKLMMFWTIYMDEPAEVYYYTCAVCSNRNKLWDWRLPRKVKADAINRYWD